MTTKLTLTIEAEIIEVAKKYASMNGRSLSDIVENYLKGLPVKKDVKQVNYSPKVKKLKGIIPLPEDFDYKTLIGNEITKKYTGK
jgi:hypothetical protein